MATAPRFPRHVFQQFQGYSEQAQDLSAILNRIALAGKLIARRLSRAGLMEGALGFTGDVNVQGESVKKMDVYANGGIHFGFQAERLGLPSSL